MTTQTTTQTPELLNKVHITGEVFSHDLKIENKEVNVNTDKGQVKKKMDVIQGGITIRTGENETHNIRIYARSQKNDGGENGQFKGYKTLKEEMITVKEIAENTGKQVSKFSPEQLAAYGEDVKFEDIQPTQLKVDGSLNVSEYVNERGMQAFLQVQGQWLNRLKDDEEYKPLAKYDVEGIVIKKRPEKKKDEETGRYFVTLLIPTYRAAIELEFVTSEKDGEYIEENFNVNDTVNLHGTIVNHSEKVVKVIPAAFGEDKTEVSYNNTRELRIKGGSIYEYDEDASTNKAYSPEQVKELQAKRNTYLAQIEADAEEKQKGKTKGTFGAKTPENGGAKVDVAGFF